MDFNETLEQLKNTIEISGGAKQVDLLLKNARIINTFAGDIHEDNVAIHNGKVVGFGDYNAKETIDLQGAYLAPGFIDGHVHIESSMVKVSEFAKAVMPCGTTTAVIDPHEIANVLGLDGISYMLASGLKAKLGVYVMLPSCVPSSPLETSGANLSAHDLALLMNDKRVLGLGEMMNYPGVLNQDRSVMEKLAMAQEKIIDGHAPMLRGKQLYAYVSAGIRSDHECQTVEEAREKLHAGMHIMIREGTAAKNLRGLLPLVNSENSRKFMFCTDDRELDDIAREGHINYSVKTAISLGIPPIRAIQMATINAAEYFNLKDLGVIAPGYQADLVVLKDLKNLDIKKVFKKGELVAENGRILPDKIEDYHGHVRSTINVKWIEHDNFVLKTDKKYARIINITPGQLATRMTVEEVKKDGDFVICDIEKDVLKIAVIERHTASGRVAVGLIRGFGLKKGAIASSISHDSHDIVVIGTNDGDMYTAAVQIVKMQGGMTVTADNQVLEALPLPIGGLMADRSADYVREKLSRLKVSAKLIGSKLENPFMTMGFMSLPPIPEIRITDLGIIDAVKFKVTDLFTDSPAAR